MSKRKNSKILETDFSFIAPIKPKTINQNNYLEIMKNNDIVFGIGPAGTGKTLLAVDYSIRNILNKNYYKTIITRPIVEAGEKLGFLPGDLYEKIDPYVRPIVCYIENTLKEMKNYNLWVSSHIEFSPLAFMRGRTFDNSILILDEAQNTTKEQMKMFLTRIGNKSKAIITADPSQIDLNKEKSCFPEILEILKDQPKIGFVYFQNEDIIRSEIVKTIVNAYNEFNKIGKDFEV